MEEKQTRDVSETELAEMLENMPDDVVVQVVFSGEGNDDERG